MVSPTEAAAKRRRYHLAAWRSFHAEALGSGGARTCMTALGSSVQVHYGIDGTTHVRGVARCGGVWVCPVCAPQVLATRGADIQEAVRRWQEAGGTVWFVTGTVPHRKGDPLAGLLDRLQRMWRFAWTGPSGKGARDDCGVRFTVRTLEVTYGTNGWHPHVHGLWFCDGDTFDPAKMAKRWRAAYGAEGLEGRYVPHVSFDVSKVEPATDGEAGAYLAKAEWGIGLEMTRADLKRGSLTAPQVLELASTGEAEWVELWREYERATKRRNMIVWSRGLRDAVGLDDELTDEEAAAGEDAAEVVALAIVPASVWSNARQAGRLGELLRDCMVGEHSRWHVHIVRTEWGDTASSHSASRPNVPACSYQPI